MITEDLVLYIQNQTKKNISHEDITTRLLRAGWHIDDIEAGFLKLVVPPKPSGEIISNTSSVQIAPKEIEETELKKVESSIDIDTESNIEIQNLELESPLVIEQEPIKEIKKEEKVETVQEPKVWIPMSLEKDKEEIPTSDTNATDPVIEVQSLEITSPSPIKPVVIEEEEHIPVLVPKPQSVVVPTIPMSSIVDSLPQKTHMSNFTEDFIKANKNTKEVQIPKKTSLKRILFVLAFVLIIFGIIFSFYKGYISLPSFIKKDPKIVLLNTPDTLSKLDSYKSNTTVTISSPSFANISSGLISGEEILSNDKDSLSINLKNTFNKIPVLYTDHIIELSSSFWKNKININTQYHNSSFYFTFSDLRELFGDNAPLPSTLFVPEGKSNTLKEIIPKDSKVSFLRNIDLDILLVSLTKDIDTNIKHSLAEFIQSSDVSVKEDSSNDDMYAYELIPNRENTKKFLVDVASDLSVESSVEDQKKTEELLGAVVFDKIEFSVNKKDNTLHSYKINISVPLSRIIGLEDKGIGDNKVTLVIDTVYSDINVKNNINVINQGLDISDFMNNLKDMKLKDNMSLFKVHAKSLRNAQGYYGKSKNINGNCVEPVSSSLFSPVGHKKSAASQVGDIAHDMNTILSDPLNASGACYSDTNTWAFAFPLKGNTSTPSFYCIDSKNNAMMITYPLTTTSCK